MKKLILVILSILLLTTPCYAKKGWIPARTWTGGGDGALDAVDGTDLVDGQKAYVYKASGQTDIYNLDVDSALTEDSTNYSVISPDANAGDKRWIKIWSGGRAIIGDSTIDTGDDSIVGTLAWHVTNASSNPTTVTVLPGTYKITTNITTPITMTLDIKHGGLFKPDAAKNLEAYSPEHIKAGPRQQIIDATNNSTNPLLFTAGGEVFAGWLYDGGTYWAEAINLAILSLADASVTDPVGVGRRVGGTVTMPVGELLIDASIIIAQHSIVLQGSGSGGRGIWADQYPIYSSTTIRNKTGTDDAIIIGKADTYLQDIILRNFIVDGDSNRERTQADGEATDGSGIRLDSFNYPSGVSSLAMYNVGIHHADAYGLHIKGNVFENSFFNVHFRHNEYGIYSEAPYGNAAENAWFGCQIWKSVEHGFFRVDANAYIFSGCTIGLNKVGMNTGGGMAIVGCQFEQNTDAGINVEGFATNISATQITGSTVGINMLGSSANHTKVHGVSFASNTDDIIIVAQVQNAVLSGLGANAAQGTEVTVDNSARSTVFLDANYEIITEAGAARTRGLTELSSGAGAMAVTLANGAATGQRKSFHFITDGGDVTLTVAAHSLGSNKVFVFRDANDYMTFEWAYGKWITVTDGRFTGGETETIQVVLTATQVKALATPIEIVPAPGAGRILEFISATLAVNYSGTGNWAEPSAPDDLVIEYQGTGVDVMAEMDVTGFIDQTNDELRWVLPTDIPTTDLIVSANRALQLHNSGGNYTDNGGTPTATLIVSITYRVLATGL